MNQINTDHTENKLLVKSFHKKITTMYSMRNTVRTFTCGLEKSNKVFYTQTLHET